MLSDEERKAIESFKEENNNDLSRFDDFNSYTQFKVKRDKIIIDLIEKQQKEIEELKEKNKTLKNLQNDTNRLYIEMIERKNYFKRELQKVKDKIKAKIEELDKAYEDSKNEDGESEYYYPNYTIEVLQSLLEKE